MIQSPVLAGPLLFFQILPLQVLLLAPILLAQALPARADQPVQDAPVAKVAGAALPGFPSTSSPPCPQGAITTEPGLRKALQAEVLKVKVQPDTCLDEQAQQRDQTEQADASDNTSHTGQSAHAQAPDPASSPDQSGQPQTSEELRLGEAAQNPISSLISLPFQNNTTFGLNRPGLFDTQNGGLADQYNFNAEDLDTRPGRLNPGRRRRTIRRLKNFEDETLNVLNIQPVIPISLNDNLTLVTRTILPVVSKPSVLQGQVWGLGDLNPTLFLVPKSSGPWTLGLGPTFQIPTATDDVLGTGKWSGGPSAVAVYTKGPWVAGGLVSQIWSFSGDSDRGDVSSLLIQPFINYNFPTGWFLTTSPIITANWERREHQWTVPLGGGVGRTFKLGTQPVVLTGEVYGFPLKPSGAGDVMARLTFKLLFPTR